MIYLVVTALVILWFIGLLANYTMGGVIHILLLFAIVMVFVNLVSGRRTM